MVGLFQPCRPVVLDRLFFLLLPLLTERLLKCFCQHLIQPLNHPGLYLVLWHFSVFCLINRWQVAFYKYSRPLLAFFSNSSHRKQWKSHAQQKKPVCASAFRAQTGGLIPLQAFSPQTIWERKKTLEKRSFHTSQHHWLMDRPGGLENPRLFVHLSLIDPWNRDHGSL